MAAKKKVLGLAVALGVAIAAVIQLRWMARMEKGAAPEAAPTNAVAQVVATNATADIVAKVKVKGEQRTDKHSAVHLPSSPSPSPSPIPPPKVRKPITNDPNVPKARQVLLANRRIAVATGRSFPEKFCAAQTPTARGTAPYVVICEKPVSRDVRIQAVADGAKVVGFLPNNAMLVEADAQALKNLEEDAAFFTAAVEYEPTDKIQRAVMEGERGERAGETVEVTVVLLNVADCEAVMKFVTDNGGTPLVGAPSEKSFSATMPRLLVEKLAGKAEVKWIERKAKLKLHNDVAVKPGLMNVTPVREAPLGLTGAGQTITTSDSGIDTGDRTNMHPDIEHNLVGFQRSNMWLWDSDYWGESTDTSGHGTHTAGSIVGDGTRSGGQFRGAAYGAKLWAWFCGNGGGICPPLDSSGSWYDFARTFRPNKVDAHIHSASWGSKNNLAEYEEMCVSVDEYAWNHADFLPVFAAGNEGKGQTPETVTPPATAKNALAVGATENVRTGKEPDADNAAQIASFSSCGPCVDGRIKPDIVAPGTYVLSCLSSQASRDASWNKKVETYDYYQYMGGTSMATPLTAGTAALVREWLAKYRRKSAPSAALVKAILTGGATDLKNESGNNVLKNVPDTRQGWGRVNLADTIAPAGLGVYLADWLPFRAGTNFTFRVTTTNAAPLNVQLVWVDYPGEPEAGPALVNDLDLSVSAAGQTWLGNGGKVADDVNNVESVRIREAEARTYIVRVKCPAVTYAFDEGGAAAIYIRGAFDPAKVECDPQVGTFILVE